MDAEDRYHQALYRALRKVPKKEKDDLRKALKAYNAFLKIATADEGEFLDLIEDALTAPEG